MNLWNRFFRKKQKLANESFVNPITTELHSHLIPGIDDGVQVLAESIDVLKELSVLGYKKVITTPHIMGDYYKNSAENILPALRQIQSELVAQNIPIELHAAAEYMVDDALQEKIETKSLLTFGQNYVLIEMPFMEPSPNFKEIIFALNINGYKPVLAHPERYNYYALNPRKYEELWESEILFQLNINSLIGFYSPLAQKAAEFLVDKQMVSMVGSDTHGMRHIPVLQQALKSYYYEKVCELNLSNNQL